MNLLEEDFERILKKTNLWKRLRGQSILITGASGMIGSYLVRMFHYANIKYGYNNRILALVRNKEKAKRRIGGCACTILTGDIRWPLPVAEPVDYIFHCAAVTNSIQMTRTPVETSDIILQGTRRVLELAAYQKIKGMVYLSTMEVYGSSNSTEQQAVEDTLGQIDLFCPRSCYPLSKRMAEHLCYAYYKEYKVPVKIARLAQTFGAGTLLDEDARIFAQIARSVMEGKDIVLHTPGDSVGNYCYLADSILGILTILSSGTDGEPYNVTNECCAATIREMAEMVARDVANGKICVVVDLKPPEQMGYPTARVPILSQKKLEALGWLPQVDLKEMYQRMIDYTKDHIRGEYNASFY